MATSSSLPAYGLTRLVLTGEGKDPNTLPSFRTIAVGEDFVKTIGWELKEGRDFSKEFATDSLAVVVLNESAVKQIGMKKEILLGKYLKNDQKLHCYWYSKDMIMESPQTITATCFFYNQTGLMLLLLQSKRIASKNRL